MRSVGERNHQIVGFYVSEDANCTEGFIRQHLMACLPEYMVPALLIELTQLPVTANGKIDRKALSHLAENSKIHSKPKTPPHTQTEKSLASIWQTLLNIQTPNIEDNFFELGGTSLLAVRLLNAITEHFAKTLPLISILRHGTIQAQAQLLDEFIATCEPVTTRNPLVLMREGGAKILLLVHPVGGNILCYRTMLQMIPPEFTVIGLQSAGDGSTRSLNAMAQSYMQAFLNYSERLSFTAQPKSIYLLGWSMGGVLAHEMARQFEAQGTVVNRVIMIDSWTGAPIHREKSRLAGAALINNFAKDFLQGSALPEGLAQIAQLPEAQQTQAAINILNAFNTSLGQLSPDEFIALMSEHQANYNALIQHKPGTVKAQLFEFRATQAQVFPMLEPLCTQGLTQSSITHFKEDHFSIIQGDALHNILKIAFN